MPLIADLHEITVQPLWDGPVPFLKEMVLSVQDHVGTQYVDDIEEESVQGIVIRLVQSEYLWELQSQGNGQTALFLGNEGIPFIPINGEHVHHIGYPFHRGIFLYGREILILSGLEVSAIFLMNPLAP